MTIYCVGKYICHLMVAVLSDREMVTMMFVVSHVDPGGGDLLYRTAGGHHHGRHTERDRVGGNIYHDCVGAQFTWRCCRGD